MKWLHLGSRLLFAPAGHMPRMKQINQLCHMFTKCGPHLIWDIWVIFAILHEDLHPEAAPQCLPEVAHFQMISGWLYIMFRNCSVLDKQFSFDDFLYSYFLCLCFFPCCQTQLRWVRSGLDILLSITSSFLIIASPQGLLARAQLLFPIMA